MPSRPDHYFFAEAGLRQTTIGTAKAIGLDIPPTLLATADEVIE